MFSRPQILKVLLTEDAEDGTTVSALNALKDGSSTLLVPALLSMISAELSIMLVDALAAMLATT